MSTETAAVWALSFAAFMLATCWRPLAQQRRARRCVDVVSGTCDGVQTSTWIHGDAGEETKLARPVYHYGYGGEHYESAAGAAVMLFELSPAAHSQGEPVELLVNPLDPREVYDPAYESWFAKYRIAWGVAACVGAFALVSLLQAIT